jgi:hypothetical protein
MTQVNSNKYDRGLPSGIPPCARCRREAKTCSFSFAKRKSHNTSTRPAPEAPAQPHSPPGQVHTATFTPPAEPQPVGPPAQLTQADLNKIVIDYLAKRGYHRTKATLQAESKETVIPKNEDTWDNTEATGTMLTSRQAALGRNLNYIVFSYLTKRGYSKTKAMLRDEITEHVASEMEGRKEGAGGEDAWVKVADRSVKAASEDEDWVML